MLKQVYRVLILIGVFVASLFYFSRDIKEVVFHIDNTTYMADATFPMVTIRAGNEEINRIHGYSSNLDANLVREGVIPLGEAKTFDVIIDQEAFDIKKLNYEIREFVGNKLIETNSVSVFEENENNKTAKIKLKAALSKQRDYALKITLVSSESKKLYFYQRVKLQDEVYLSEKLDFIKSFHEAIKDKATAGWITDRLESDPRKDNSTLARVNIYSSFELITWGDIKPEFLTEAIPTVIEISPGLATVVLNYIIKADIAGVPELFEVSEFYRVQYNKNQTYLLNYERSMESLFDTKLASVSKSQLKLGITSDASINYLVSDDKNKLAFVRSRELWFYDLEKNKMTRVFSFRQDITDYIRDYYDQHDVRILNMDPEGNIDFIVYGYMNRGQYEGRVGIVLYRFVRAENRIEEIVYLPADEPYQTLKEKIGDFAFVNDFSVFYFHFYNNIYSYDLITGQLKVLAEGIEKNQLVFMPEKAIVAWQGNPNPRLSKDIKIMELHSGDIQTIDTRTGYNILLLDMIDSNLVYGLAVEVDITTLPDGRTMVPLYMLEIASIDRNILKSYSKPGYYVTDIKVNDNIIELNRVMRVNDNGNMIFQIAPQDYIMNQIKKDKPLVEVITRVTEQALTENYLTLPSGFTMTELPEVDTTNNTVITKDPTIRLHKEDSENIYYYSYIGGEIIGSYPSAAQAIAEANAGVGAVWNSLMQPIWERIAKPTRTILPGYDTKTIAKTDATLESCIRMLLQHVGKGSGIQIELEGSSAYEILSKYMEETPINLTGITLDEALYYVADGKPVIAMTDHKDAVLIYGYDGFNINVADPKQGKVRKIGLQDSRTMFDMAGNVYLSYLEQ